MCYKLQSEINDINKKLFTWIIVWVIPQKIGQHFVQAGVQIGIHEIPVKKIIETF
jgi:hypothetical protein